VVGVQNITKNEPVRARGAQQPFVLLVNSLLTEENCVVSALRSLNDKECWAQRRNPKA
jgi:hypothetical protein